MLRCRTLVIVLFLVSLVGMALAVEDDGTGESYWGEIPPEDAENTEPLQNNDRPLWEDLIYYPYQVVAWVPRTVAGGLGSTVAWASNPKVYGTTIDVVTLSFIPVRGRVGISAGGGDGFGASYSLTHDEFMGPHNRMKLGLGRSTEKKSKATLGFLFGDGQTNSYSLGLGYRLNPVSRFFGLGHDSIEDQESYFTNEAAWAGIGYRRKIAASTWIETDAMYSTAATRGSWGKESESIEAVFAAVEDHPVGFGDQSDGSTFTLGLHRDSTLGNGRPEQGGIQRAQLSLFTETGGNDVSFWSERFEIQQFFPLWHTRRGFALKGIYTRLHSSGDDPIPFQRMLTNDDPDLFRGYRDLRFRDVGLLAFSAEYRFPAWNYRSIDGLGLDAYLFVDRGQVFEHSREISLPNLTLSYGGGLRLLNRAGFGGNLEFGFSDEDMVIRLGAQQSFQFGKGGLLHGRNPIPHR